MFEQGTRAIRHVQQQVKTSYAGVRRYSSPPRFKPNGANTGLIQHLLHSRDEEDSRANRNVFKIRAFDKAIRTIDSVDFRIQSASVQDFSGIGAGIARRIQDYLDAGEEHNTDLSAEEFQKVREQRNLARELQKVPGIGPVKAKYLVEMGCSSISDLHLPAFRNMLPHKVQVELDFKQHLSEAATKEEADKVVDAMRQVLYDSSFKLHVVGSYRRGATSMKDIEILLVHDSFKVSYSPPGQNDKLERTPINKKLWSSIEESILAPLKENGIIMRTTLVSGNRWAGIVRVPQDDEELSRRVNEAATVQGQFRRMHISFAAMESQGAALLALTGDSHFNKSMRTEAVSLGMHLDEYGLWRNYKHDWDEADTAEPEWRRCSSVEEEEIFRELGMDFVQPERRNLSNLVKARRRVRNYDIY